MLKLDGVKYCLAGGGSEQSGFYSESDNELLMYAFVRDIDFENGLHLIIPNDCQNKLSQLTTIVPVSPKLFSIP